MLIIPIIVSIFVVMLFFITFTIVVSSYKDYKSSFKSNVQPKLVEMFLFIEPFQIFIFSLIFVLLVFYSSLILIGSYSISLVLSLFAFAAPHFAIHLVRKRRRDKITAQLPDFLMSVSRAMQAGSSLNQSLETAIQEDEGPLIQEFTLIMYEVRLGVDFNEALDKFGKRVPIEEVQLVITAMKISREIGGNLSDAILRLSETLRKKLETEGKINSLTAQGRLQGIVMTLLPIFLGFILYNMQPQEMERLILEPIGWAVLAVIFVLQALGYFFIRKIVNIDV